MPVVNFVSHDGSTVQADVASGTSIMQAALDSGIDGIIAECGGACSCATCHCYVDKNWLGKTGEAEEIEKEMLECVLEPQDNSRLSCQISVTDEMDGIVINIPESQY
jgi:2Fe-2S ferredoxin